VHGLAHITGALIQSSAPWGLRVEIRLPKFSGLFAKLSEKVPEKEMYTVFNCALVLP